MIPMLTIRRKPGQWFEVTHQRSGDRLRIWVARASPGSRNVELRILDQDRDFEVERGERLEQRHKERS